jgi:nitroreductase
LPLGRVLAQRSAGSMGTDHCAGVGGSANVVAPPGELEALTGEEIAAYVVAAAVWAPSLNNTQPWLFGTDGQELRLYADGGRRLTVADPAGRQMLISCGAALFTARLALRSAGRIPRTSILPDPADPLLVARLRWPGHAASAGYERQLFDQVLRRRTHRGGFEPVPLAPALLAVLQAGARRDGAQLRIITDAASQAVLAATVQTAEQTLRLDSTRVQEMTAWVSPPNSPRRDGVPATSYPARPARTVPDFPGRDFARGRGWGLPPASGDAAARSAGTTCLLTTTDDRPVDWVNAGQALQRILLTAAAYGVAAALHSQPLELGWLREFIRTRLADGSYPQLVLRLGTVIQTAASVRRPPASVLFQHAAQGHGGQPVAAALLL